MGLKSPFGPLVLAEIGPFLPRFPPHFSKGNAPMGEEFRKRDYAKPSALRATSRWSP